ncbi:hypothetical protein Kpol_257p1, partial [Vanderwaltozyma polyspora DSM 70294]
MSENLDSQSTVVETVSDICDEYGLMMDDFIQSLNVNKGIFQSKNSLFWCNDLSSNIWHFHDRVSINNKGSLSYHINSKYVDTEDEKERENEGYILQNLQNCKIKLIKDSSSPTTTLLLSVKVENQTVYIKANNINEFQDLLACLFWWSSFAGRGIFNKISLQKIDKNIIQESRDIGILEYQFDIFTYIPTSDENIIYNDVIPFPNCWKNVSNKQEYWFSAKGVLSSNGILKIKNIDNDNIIYTLDIKQLLRSEIRYVDPSLLKHSPESKHCLFVGLLPKLRNELRYTGNNLHFSNDIENLIIKFDSKCSLENWYLALKMFTINEVLSIKNIDKSNQLRISNRFMLSIIEAEITSNNRDNNINNSGFYAEVICWDHIWNRTFTIYNTSSPFWREEFHFDESVPLNKLPFVIRKRPIENMIIYGNSLDDFIIGRIDINQETMNDPKLNQSLIRLPIFSTENSNIEVGTLCVKISSSMNLILPPVNFKKFEKILRELPLPKIADIAYSDTICSNLRLEDVSEILLDFFQSYNREDDWFVTLLNKELLDLNKKSSESLENGSGSNHILNSIFRSNSILTKSLERYFYRIGEEYLNAAIGDILREIVISDDYCEIDASKININDNIKLTEILEENRLKLIGWVTKIWNAIYTTNSDLPFLIKSQLKNLRKKLDLIYPDRNEEMDRIILKSVSSILFLRFFCPVILNPKLFNFIETLPNENTRRTFTLITKTLLNLSTLTRFETKEPWMRPMNEFIDAHREEMLDYVDKATLKHLDFTPKVLNLKDPTANKLDFNINNDYLLSIINSLPTNPYRIDRYLRVSEFIIILTAYIKQRDEGVPMIKNINMNDVTKIFSKYSIAEVIESNKPDIGELSFEKITE